MCSRFTLNLGDAISLSKRLGIPLGASAPTETRYNIAPSTGVTTLRHGTAATLHWGLIPHWSRRDHAPSSPLINARSETVAEKPSFRTAWNKRQRCLIPTSGFYEWEKDGRARLPWIFARRDGEPTVFAGLWDRWQDPIDDTVIESCTVLTTTANALLGRIHDRMPVILDATTAATWLDPDLDLLAATELMRPFDANLMTETALDQFVNSSRHEGPDCLTPRGQSPGAQLGFDL
jgi:putative SOS response-associated peptidase YedK